MQDIIPEWPCWPIEQERALAWDSFEQKCYGKFIPDLDTVLLNLNGIAPTVLHSCGHDFYGCPCNCRATGLSETRLARDGVSTIAIRSEHDGSIRHPHPMEVGFLCTVWPSFQYPTSDIRAGLPLVGQIAAPLPAHWVGCQLREILVSAGVSDQPFSFDALESHFDFIGKLQMQRRHHWPPTPGLHFNLVLEFPHGGKTTIRFASGARVKHLLHAQASISEWGTRLALFHQNRELALDCYLLPENYQIKEHLPKNLKPAPVDLVRVRFSGLDLACEIQVQAGTRVWEALDLAGLPRSLPPSLPWTLADPLWTSSDLDLRGAGLDGLGISSFDLEEEATLLLSQVSDRLVHLFPAGRPADTLAKPPVVAAYAIRVHLQGLVGREGPPHKIGAFLCIRQHWILFFYDVITGKSQIFDGLLRSITHETQVLAQALASFFNHAPQVHPADSILLQGNDDFCGAICLANLGWQLGLWDDFSYEDVKAWHFSIRRQEELRGAGATDWATAHAWLIQFLPSRGVPEDKVAERAALALKKLSLNGILKAIQDPNPWKQLKTLGSNASKPFLWVTADELKEHISKRASQKFSVEGPETKGRKKNKRELKPQSVVQLNPASLAIPDNIFVDEEGKSLKQIPAEAVKLDSRGVAVVALDQALRFIADSKILSHDHLALLTPEVVPSSTPGSLDVLNLTWPAIFESEPLLIRGSLVQLGDKVVALKTNQAPKTGAVDTSLLRIQLYKDQTNLPWEEVLKGPLKLIINHYAPFQLCAANGCGPSCPKYHRPIDDTCDLVLLDCFAWRWYNSGGTQVSAQKATSFSVMVRTPATASDGLLALSGKDGFYSELREDQLDSPRFAVIWLKQDHAGALHLLQTQPHALHLARLHSKYGLRCLKKHEAVLRAALFPDQPFVECEVTFIYQVGPWPYGSSKKNVQDIIERIPWTAKVLRPSKSGHAGRYWLVGAPTEPPQRVFTSGSQHITISLVKDAQPTRQESNIVASLQTMQRLQGHSTGRAQPDPMMTADPWAAYRTQHMAPNVEAPPIKRIEAIQQELQESVHAQIQEQFAAFQDAPMEEAASSRMLQIESDISELRLQAQTFNGWFSESAAKMTCMQTTIEEQGRVVENLQQSVQQQAQNTMVLQNQLGTMDQSLRNTIHEANETLTARLEALLGKRPRTAE